MLPDRLHIICFDIPYPPSYGGAIDVFYRIKALSEAGVRVTAHCFYKGEGYRADELERICEKVYYYPRKTSLWQFFGIRPYVVRSRTDSSLLNHLLQDDAPILFEGLVSCALMAHKQLRQRDKYFRECNVEHDYYHALGKASSSLWKKGFFYIEALRLRYFERVLQHAKAIFALARQDETYFKTRYPQVQTLYVPCFHQYQAPSVPTGKGTYVLYHGNLSVAENHKAAMYIIHQLAPSIPYPVVIAGNRPDNALRQAVSRCPRITLVDSPDAGTMDRLIRDAQVHLLITFQATGIKLKLLNVLYAGRHVVANPLMVTGTGLDPLCHIGHTAQELVDATNALMNESMSDEAIKARTELLGRWYDNATSARQIIHTIYNHD